MTEAMQIWVDADACPRVIKDILFKASRRVSIALTLVANQSVQVPRSPIIKSVQVAQGFDVADNYIVQRVQTGDLVITSDIPLAAEVVESGGFALSPRGELYDTQNIRERLNMRDFMDTLRGTGMDTGGPPVFSQTDRRDFANQLDRQIQRMLKG